MSRRRPKKPLHATRKKRAERRERRESANLWGGAVADDWPTPGNGQNPSRPKRNVRGGVAYKGVIGRRGEHDQTLTATHSGAQAVRSLNKAQGLSFDAECQSGVDFWSRRRTWDAARREVQAGVDSLRARRNREAETRRKAILADRRKAKLMRRAERRMRTLIF